MRRCGRHRLIIFKLEGKGDCGGLQAGEKKEREREARATDGARLNQSNPFILDGMLDSSGQNGQRVTRHSLVRATYTFWLLEPKSVTNCYRKTLRGSRDRVPKESPRRGATRPNEVASLMSHVSLAVIAESMPDLRLRSPRTAVKSRSFHGKGARWLDNTATWM